MKKLMLALTICLFTLPTYAEETFTVITKDNEVTSVDAVQVKKAVTTEQTAEEILTLRNIDSQIAAKQARIAHLQKDVTDLQALRATVLKEAEKVVLKEVEPPSEPEEPK